MVQFNRPWMLCMLLFIATVARITHAEISINFRGPTKLDHLQYRTFRKIINVLQYFPSYFRRWIDETDILSFGRDEYSLPGGQTEPYNYYHYVIIGAGTAGSALASSLSQNKSINVLLIEAGKPESILTDIPILAPLFQRTEYATEYVTEKQEGSCWGMENQRCVFVRGRAVGGNSVINNMAYSRGRRVEWERIAANNCTEWSYKNVLRYYIKSEQCHLKDYKNEPHRGREGKVHVEDVKIRTPLAHAFLDAARLYEHNVGDYNSEEGFGFGYLQATLKNGRRHSAARAYLYPHRHRSNLHILHSTTATKILFDKDKTAYAVQYKNRYGDVRFVIVEREVIVSAGPIASAQLLMLSGIGPASHLESLGIPVVKDLAVGRTLYDHLYFPGQIYMLNTRSVTLHETNALAPKQIIKWFVKGSGLAGSPGVEAIGYIKTIPTKDPDQVSDVELMDYGGSIVSDLTRGGSQAVRKGARITDETFYSAFSSIGEADTWSAAPVLLHPKSKGYLELRDKNPFSHPRIYTNYFKDQRDVAAMIAAIRHVQELTKTPSFQRYEPRLHNSTYPQCMNLEFDTDLYWECALRTLATSLNHQTGTCKMGPPRDPEAVVDPKLRVYGVYKLRVVGASVIPQTISAHTNALGMMMGARVANLIKFDWRNV